MSLESGASLGPYEILSKLGAGGMGEVYRARDTKLNRDVAIKVLPDVFAQDAERLARFTREAQTLAALNHPNIAAIYGLEDVGSGQQAEHTRIQALVMELVEGEDLSTRIARGPVPLDEALPIARQIADALEAAHEQGIIHRDLKPGNVKVRPDGTVKVLDFGLAKAMDPAGTSGASATESPTLTARATAMGMLIGTAAYMAPEQAKGKPVDKRADIWAFGVVLYEMLTGRRAFEGEDISTTLAAVIMRDPEWTSLPSAVPPGLQRLIRRCLDRDPRERLRDIGEARLLLADPEALRSGPEPGEAVATPARSSRLPWIVAGAGLLAASVFGALWLAGLTAPPDAEHIEASLAPPPGHSIGASFALSPDGRQLVTEAVDRETGTVSLWLRDLSSGVPTRLSGTDGGIMPFWSPDGLEIAFFAEGKLKKTDLQGSPPQVICDAQTPRGGAWGPDGTIVFSASFRTGLEQVDAAGGTPLPLTTLDETRHEKSHRWPVFLPDGAHVLFLAQTGEATSKDDASTIEVLTLATGERTRLLMANSSPLYSAAGFVLFWREDALRAQAFDTRTLAVSGPVMSVAAGVAFDSNEYAQASVSATGTLVYSTADTSNRTDLILVDRSGRPMKTIAESVLIEGGVALSHDDTRLAAAVTAGGARDTDIWIYDLERGTSGPLTFDEGGDGYPLWSTDDTELAYANDRVNDGIVFRRFTDGRGQAEQMATNATGLWSRDWSRDGRWLVVGAVADTTGFDLWRYDLDSQALEALVDTPFNDQLGALSPDDRWLAYQSDETGRPEIYVRSLGSDAGRWRISSLGGVAPLWRGDGRELYFMTPLGQVMAVEVEAGAAFRAAMPKELFRANFRRLTAAMNREYAPSADGQRFVINALKERSTSLVTLVTNWTASIGGER